MFIAGIYYLKNKKQVDSSAEEAVKQLKSAGESAGSIIRTTSTGILQQAQRCYPDQHPLDQEYHPIDKKSPACLNMTKEALTSESSALNGFRDDIRQEWIDATFGKEFYRTKGYIPPRQGVGESGIGSYVTFGATINEKACETGDKVGVMLSRIAVGLYVKRVEPGSEAHCAGVKEGSVLVDINGMGMLGEPSKQALERIWQYEGHFDRELNSNDNTMKEPMALRLIKGGQLYSCVMFCRPPYGITWAPCGQFPLVQKAYSFAAEAGAKKGCLVVAVNDQNIRNLDHQEAASHLRSLFVEGEKINLTFAYTPPAARSGQFERMNTKEKSEKPNSTFKKRTLASIDGVEVRTHPLEYGKLFSGGGPKVEPERQILEGRISQLAVQVAAGYELPYAGGRIVPNALPLAEYKESIPKASHFHNCPSLPMDELLKKWDPVDAVLFCLAIHQADYDFYKIGNVLREGDGCDRFEILQHLAQNKACWSIADAFLLQCVSVICISEEEETTSEIDNFVDSRFSKEMSSILLAMSRCNEEFCQRLYFVLRSYTATLEGRRKKDDSNSNMLTVLQALERLRSTQKQLASQLTSENGYSLTDSKCDSPGLVVASSESSPEMISTSIDRRYEMEQQGSRRTKTVSVFKRFKKKKKKKHDTIPAPSTISVLSGKTHSSIDSAPTSPTKPHQQQFSDKRTSSLTDLSLQLEYLSVSSLLENMTRFLIELDRICDAIEGSLLKSISQKIADWALQPWSASKEGELTKVTEGMRNGLQKLMLSHNHPGPLANPFNSSEVLLSIDSDECYILPSAHFPLLLTFNIKSKQSMQPTEKSGIAMKSMLQEEKLYRTKVQIVAIRKSASPSTMEASDNDADVNQSYVVQAAIAGNVKESDMSTSIKKNATVIAWENEKTLNFDTRSCWGTPNTLSLSVFTVPSSGNDNDHSRQLDEKGRLRDGSEIGSSWIDMKPLWEKALAKNVSSSSSSSVVTCRAPIWSFEATQPFDEHGEIPDGIARVSEQLELELKVETEAISFDHQQGENHLRKRMLLYKHDDDLRQEMFAIQFINTCSSLLKTSGLDLKLLTFRSICVGHNRGFIEWIPGSLPLSDICKPFAGSIIGSKIPREESEKNNPKSSDAVDSRSEAAQAGLVKYQSLHQQNNPVKRAQREHCLENNPIQDFLRGAAYDAEAPYFINREVMDNYIKSCAGYCVITYILGVGDRHLDNLLLHQNGHFFHCDYSFILGNDPKKYLPMRITEEMVSGMGGLESDGYAKFLSLAGATFVALRRHENVRVILSMVRSMIPSALPDISVNQTPEQVLDGLRQRLRLDLSDEESISYMEKLIENSLKSKIWIAVDAMHSIGKRF